MNELPVLECKGLDEQHVYIWLKERNEPLVGPLVVRYGAEIVKRCNDYEKQQQIIETLLGLVKDFIKSYQDDEEVEINWELFGDTKIKAQYLLAQMEKE